MDGNEEKEWESGRKRRESATLYTSIHVNKIEAKKRRARRRAADSVSTLCIIFANPRLPLPPPPPPAVALCLRFIYIEELLAPIEFLTSPCAFLFLSCIYFLS